MQSFFLNMRLHYANYCTSLEISQKLVGKERRSEIQVLLIISSTSFNPFEGHLEMYFIIQRKSPFSWKMCKTPGREALEMNPYLVADPDLTNLLFIIAYRDDEVDKDENKAAPERIYRDRLTTIPTMNNPEIGNVNKMMAQMTTACWFHDKKLYLPLLYTRFMPITLPHGMSEYTSFAYSNFAIVLNITGNIKAGYQFAQVALTLLDKCSPKLQANEIMLVHEYISH